MNKLLTALILTVTAAAAQAGEVNLTCDYKGVDGSARQTQFVFDPALGGGSQDGKLEFKVATLGTNYVLTDRMGTRTINRETLAITMDFFGNVTKGSCKISSSKNQI